MDGTPFGRYLLLEVLGRGGMGEVWRAHDTSTDRTVALKLLPAHLAQDTDYQLRFRREAHAAAQLTEPHVVPIHDYGEIDGRLYVDMRLIEGRDLHSLLTDGPLDPARAVLIIDQVAAALDAAHEIGLVHRDVKPSNILVARFDFTYLIDFGIARAPDDTGLTSTNRAIGTLHYMAPERFREGRGDARSDVYALACVLHECLTGRRPFLGESVEQQIAGHLMTPPPRPSTVVSGVSSKFDAVIAKGMAKDPDERYQTTFDLAHAARAAVTTTVAPSARTRNRRPSMDHQRDVCTQPAPAFDTSTAAQQAQQPDNVDHVPPLGFPRLPDGRNQARAGASIDELLEHAVSAISRGDHATASAIAEHVLDPADGELDADDLLAAPSDPGEIRRLTLMFADLVDSTVLSTEVEPETYRLLVGRYRDQVKRIVQRYEGHIGSTKGDGLLIVFGYPIAHENDVRRAVQAGLEITRDVARLSDQAQRRFGLRIDVRVGVHRGLVYLDTAQDDVFGLAANMAARVSGLAPPGAVVVSDSVEQLVKDAFELESLTPAPVKGIKGLISHSRVLCERAESSRGPGGPLVGRERELSRLRKSWGRAQAGTLTTPGIVLRGEAGIGKSRLVVAAMEIAEADGGVVVELAGSPFHSDVGLHPVRTLLERRCGITRLTPPRERLDRLGSELTLHGLDPATLVPLLAPVLGIAPESGYAASPVEGRKLEESILEAVLQYLFGSLGDGSGLVVVEDGHWLDPATLDLIGRLLGDADGRILVVVTGRHGDWLRSTWPAKLFELTPLTDEEVDALVHALDPTVTADECAAVRARCDGVPFYVEQVVSGLGQTSQDENRPPVPDPLYEPLFARLLTRPNVVPVVEAASVIGRHVDRGLLILVSGLPEDDVDDVLDELEDALVLEPQGTGGWRFRHELLREVAAELAPPTVRRELHARVADALISTAAGDPDWRMVASHYENAARHIDAASAYREASAAARRRGALVEARNYLTHGLSQLEKSPPGADRDRREIRPRLERGFLAAAMEGYQSPSVAEDFERCLQLVGSDLRDDEVWSTLVSVSGYYISRADLDRADQLLQLAESAPDMGRGWLRPAINGALGMTAFVRGDMSRARGYFAKALVDVDIHDRQRTAELWYVPHDPVSMAHEHLAMDRIWHGDLDGAERAMASAHQRADELGVPLGPYNIVNAIDMEIWMRVDAGQFDRARALVAEMIEKADAYGFDFWQLFGATEQCMVDAEVALSEPNPEQSAMAALITTMTEYVEFWRAVGLYIYQTHYDCILGKLLTAAGRPDEAMARIATGLKIAADTGMHFHDPELLRARARARGDADARAADLASAMRVARRQDAPLFELRAALDAFAFHGETARDGLAAAVGRLPADCPLPEVVRAQAILG
ncbi:cyclase [Mycobacterium sp. PS03-16]|uniref:serine/threonine-protein kinase n=1 Tax=Mycobacterium sp. PS03-16 TaxID=2559611 RepID=UPI0010747C9E|nr:serine/threonine-protein kinase [Mycobacterium sp. PS03-16]TFV57071.1 cyclase [Mycobacterium sp. PS03-16]